MGMSEWGEPFTWKYYIAAEGNVNLITLGSDESSDINQRWSFYEVNLLNIQ
jgi:hypothetical protein